MKNLSLIILAVFSFWMTDSFGQTIAVSANPTNLPCGGGNVDFSAVGNSTVPVFGDDFNTGTVAPGWFASPSAQFDNPCGAAMDGTTYLWMGPGTAAPRNITTAPVDVSCGGTVCFDFKFVCESCGDSSPCEGADTYAEGVSLQCSTDGGATWTDFAYFAPNGDLLTAYPGVGSPYASGNTPFTTWQNYCFTIPAGCETNNTMFQLYQWGSSGPTWDHWGIDNFYVYANPCAPFFCDWDHIPGSPDACDVTTNVTQSGWYDVCYTNGTLSACDSVFITVAGMTLNPINTTVEPCLGDDAGTATISVTGGSAPITYTIAGPTPGTNGSGSFSNLAPGNYTVTVTDNSGCMVNGNFVIDPGPACCTVTANGTDLLCNNDGSGTTTANPANGVAPYSYQWDAGTGNQTTQTATGLGAGNYTVTITDAAGCVAVDNVTINEPNALGANATPTDPSCNAVCDGQIVVSAPTGGTPGYQYNLNGGTFGGSGTFTGLCDGTFNIIVEDANGCQLALSNIVLTEPTDVTLVETSTTPATCGANNGALTVTAGGGTPPYQYDIGGAQQGSPTFGTLASGTYTVTVTDANGCTETLNVTVPSAAGPVPFIDVLNDVTCNGAFTGSVTIGVGGGTAPYTFTLNPPGPGQASNTFTGVPAGAFTVEVTDANGCTGTVNGNISEPTALQFNTTVTDASCNGVCDGEIDIDASGATPPYQYSDDNGLTFQAGDILTALCAGNVDVVVSDNNGCLANAVVVIGEPTPLTMNPSFTEPSCNGLSDGTITFAGGGATPPYTYSTDNGTTFGGADPAINISAGNYDLIIQDANGCQTPGTITVTEPPPFTFTYIANNPSNCGANDGSFEIAAIPGTPPFLYSIDGGTTQQPNGLFQNLFSGLYNLYVTDGNGCVDSTFEALSDNIMTTQVDVEQATTCYNTCDGVGIVSQMFGAPPFTYTINTGGSQPIGIFQFLCAGQHFITIEDAGLCIGIQEINIPEPDTIEFTPTGTDPLCPAGADGTIDFGAVTGGDGGPYTYSIDGGTNYQAGATFNGLTSGTYTLFAQDGNGCLGSTTITLGEPIPWDVNINFTDLVCNNDNTGFIQVVGGGATGPYNYDLNGTPSGTGIYPTLAAGLYNIQITDDNGCIFDTTQTLTEPAVLTGAYALTDPLCNGSADGEIDVTANGGTAPYLYSSDNGTIFQSSNILTGLADGCYDVLIEDDNGCQATSNECLNEPTALTMTIATLPTTCGNNNGEITLTAAGGSGGYTYTIDGTNYQAGTVFAGLAAANYLPGIQDANGCTLDSTVTVVADDQPSIDNIAFNDPLCFGAADGDITVTASGGVGVLTYSITGGAPFQAGNAFPNLNAGVYDVAVQDANGCVAILQTTLTDPPLLTIQSETGTDLLCFGDFTGAIDLVENGGTAPYQYSIDNGTTLQGSGTFSSIAAGNYITYIEDANGCTITGNVIVNEPAVLAWAPVTTDPLCFGSCDGTVTANVNGGTAPYTYSWGGNIAGAGDDMATGVCSGAYNLTVLDANACMIDTTGITLTDPAALIIPGLTTVDVSCHMGITDMSNPGGVNNDGSITITIPTGGLAPYQYSVDGGANYQAGNIFPNLAEGNYDISVLDANGCEAVSNTTIYSPDSLYSIAPSDWTSCMNEVAVIQAFTNGGSVPYSYNWTNNVNANVETTALFNYTVTQQITFTLTASDDNGCIAVPVSYTVTPTPALSLFPTPDTSICLGGTAVMGITVTGGQLIDFGTYQGYSYVWTPGAAGDTTDTYAVSPNTPTTYTITVTDDCGEVADTTINIGIHPDPIVPILGPFNGCAPDTMDFDISASVLPGYTLNWDLGNGDVTTSPVAMGVVYPNSGTYDHTITITTDQGCTITEVSPLAVNIYDDPIPGFYFNPNSPSILDPTVEIVDISENAATWNYTFEGHGTSSEQNPQITFNVDEETTINVCQYITSAEGCTAQVCIPLDIHEEILFYVPNVVTPDGDLFNEIFFPVFTSGVDPYDYHMTIFNRWGEIVFESYDFDYGWNCHYGDGGLVKDGVYIWQIEFGEKLSDKKQTHRGHVTVLK